MASTARRGFWYGYVIWAVTFICYVLTIGFTTYAYPVVMPMMLAERGWTRGDTLLATSMSAWVGLVIAPVTGFLIDRWGVRICMFLGAGATAVTFGLLTLVTELWQWMVLWGFTRPAEMRMGSTTTFITTITVWFNLRRGIALGAMLAGGGIGGAIVPVLTTWAMQTTGAWQWGWGMVAVAMASVAVVWIIFIRSRPSDIGSWPDGLSPEEAQRAREAALSRQASGRRVIATTYRSPVNWGLRDALRARAFWLTALMWVGYQCGFNTWTNQGVLQLTRTGKFTAMEAAFGISIQNIFSAPFRFFMGWVTDRIESRYVIMFGIAAGMLQIIFLWIAAAPNFWMLAVAAAMAGINTGTNFSALNAQIGNYFGTASYALILATLTGTVAGLPLSFLPAGGGYSFDLTGSYNLYFTAMLLIQGISIVSCLLCTPPRPKEQQLAASRPAA